MAERKPTRANSMGEEEKQAFLDEILEGVIDVVDNKSPEEVVSAVLCVLTQRISGGEAVDVMNILPESLQPWLTACARHRNEQPQKFGMREFQQRVAQHLEISEEMTAAVSRTVFDALQRHMTEEEIGDVESQLPTDLKNLWLPKK